MTSSSDPKERPEIKVPNFQSRAGKVTAKDAWKLAIQGVHEREQLRAEFAELKAQWREPSALDSLVRMMCESDEQPGLFGVGEAGLGDVRGYDAWAAVLRSFLILQTSQSKVHVRPIAKARARARFYAEEWSENLKSVNSCLQRLQEEFHDLDRRLVRCVDVERALGELERTLVATPSNALRWYVGILRDALNFNYSEDLRDEHLACMLNAVKLIELRRMGIDRQDCQNLHKDLLDLGLSLLPTSKRAIAEYGENPQSDGQG